MSIALKIALFIAALLVFRFICYLFALRYHDKHSFLNCCVVMPGNEVVLKCFNRDHFNEIYTKIEQILEKKYRNYEISKITGSSFIDSYFLFVKFDKPADFVKFRNFVFDNGGVPFRTFRRFVMRMRFKTVFLDNGYYISFVPFRPGDISHYDYDVACGFSRLFGLSSDNVRFYSGTEILISVPSVGMNNCMVDFLNEASKERP